MAIDAVESAEDYLERILMLQESGMKEIRSVDLANSFGYSKASISVALHKLEEKGYVALGIKNQLYLTPSGYEIARAVYTNKDACRIEHVISNESFEALRKVYEASHPKEDK